MKSIICVLLLTLSTAAQASGWIQIDVLPGSVFTKTGATRHIAILKEKGTLPPTGYECTLSVEASAEQMSTLATGQREGTWTRFTTTERLSFSDVGIKHELRLDPNRGSACLEWGEEYYDDGQLQRDCLRYAGSFRTMKNILELRDNKLKLNATLTCEKWMSDKKLELLDNFFHIIQRSESHFPLFLDAELD